MNRNPDATATGFCLASAALALVLALAGFWPAPARLEKVDS